MKILSEKQINQPIASIELDPKVGDWKNINVCEETFIVPINLNQLSKQDQEEINNVAWDAGTDNGWTKIDYDKTEAELFINTDSDKFQCSMIIHVFPLLLSAQEQQEHIDFFYKNSDGTYNEEAVAICKCTFTEIEEFYKYPKWKELDYSEAYDVELEPDETNQLLWIIVQFLFNKAYYAPVKIDPVSA